MIDTNGLYDSLQFAADTLMNAPPESFIMTAANVVVTLLAYVGIRVTPRVAAFIGSAAYACLHLGGIFVKRAERSPACKAALAALEDETAVYEGRVLTCTGLLVQFSGDCAEKILTADGLADLKDVLPGGRKGREYRAVAAKAAAVKAAVIERDRQAENEAAAARMSLVNVDAHPQHEGWPVVVNTPYVPAKQNAPKKCR